MSLSLDDQQLIDRISAMSAEQFNACVAARYEYQEALNAWIQYQDEVQFDSNDVDPLPDADMLLEVIDAEVLEDLREEMRVAIANAKQAGEDVDEDGVRQDIFTEAFSDLLKEDLLSRHDVSQEMYDDMATMDEEVYHGHLQWSLIKGAGKNLDMASRTTRHG